MIEAYIIQQGFDCTFIHPEHFMQNLTAFYSRIQEAGGGKLLNPLIGTQFFLCLGLMPRRTWVCLLRKPWLVQKISRINAGVGFDSCTNLPVVDVLAADIARKRLDRVPVRRTMYSVLSILLSCFVFKSCDRGAPAK